MHSLFRRCGYLLCCLLLALPAVSVGQEVTLNLKNVDIENLIQMVSEVTHKNFVVDERVKGKVTVISSQPMDEKVLYQTFLSILSVHNYAAIPSGEVIKIVPAAVAKSDRTPVNQNQAYSGDAMITQIIEVKHLSAAQLIPILRPLIPQQGHIAAPPNSQYLIISDRAANVSRLLKIIRRIDQKPQQDVEVMVLSHASAVEVVRILNQLKQQASPAEQGSSQYKLIADERTNSILISGGASQRLHIKTLISHLDTPLETVGNTQVIYLHYARASELVEVLKGIHQSSGSNPMVSSNMLNNGVQSKTTFTPTYNGNSGKVAVKTQIQADNATNSLIITAAPDVIQSLKSVIRKLDIRRAQVLVEAIIVEINFDNSKELGIQWAVGGTGNSTVPIGLINFDSPGKGLMDLAGSVLSNSLLVAINGATLGAGRFNPNGSLNFGILLRALAANTQANILSTPSLVTLDNQEAEIHVGQNVPFVTGQYTNTGAVAGATNPFQTIQRQDVGIKLKVKPQINEGSSIQLEIEQEVSSVVPSAISGSGIVTNKRTIKTTVMVEDGEMVVLGGLMDESLSNTQQKVPGLGDIPFIGGLFRSQSTQKVKRNLMIFLHPVILRDAAMEQQVSHGKYQFMRQQQIQAQQNPAFLNTSSDIPVLPSLNQLLSVLPGDNLPITVMP